MLHSYTKMYVHLIWSTKNRECILTQDVRPIVQRHLRRYAKERHIYIDRLNVQFEHVHVLIRLPSDQRVDDIARLLKGESSHWINAENITRTRFSWQRGYGAFSVSPSHVERVRKYIARQDTHHRRRTVAEEFKTVLNLCGFPSAETDE